MGKGGAAAPSACCPSWGPWRISRGGSLAQPPHAPLHVPAGTCLHTVGSSTICWPGPPAKPPPALPPSHRYLLHLPGWSYSGRLKYLLACGAAVVWLGAQDANLTSSYQEFWYHLLQVKKESVPVYVGGVLRGGLGGGWKAGPAGIAWGP